MRLLKRIKRRIDSWFDPYAGAFHAPDEDTVVRYEEQGDRALYGHNATKAIRYYKKAIDLMDHPRNLHDAKEFAQYLNNYPDLVVMIKSNLEKTEKRLHRKYDLVRNSLSGKINYLSGKRTMKISGLEISAATLAIIFFLGTIFISPTYLTGNVIGLNQTSINLTQITLFIAGILAISIYFKNKEKVRS